MITALIIDDEIKKAEYLKEMLEKNLPAVQILGIATSANEGIKQMLTLRPELLFLDIELQTSTGFDLLTQLRDLNFSVIFTTAHQHYALKAIKFAALDFLLKPIDVEELKTAVAKAIKEKQEQGMGKHLEVLINNLNQQNQQKKIAISTNSGIIVIDIKKIIYLKADGPYTTLFTSEGELVSSTHLKEFEHLLNDFGFYRLHKSYMVNLSEITKYKKSEDAYVIMSNGDTVYVSDKKKEELISQLSSQVLFVN